MNRDYERVSGLRWVVDKRAIILLWVPIMAITLAHYGTGAHYHYVHDILRRVYYIPIVLGAFAFGVRGALATSIVVSLVYLPHAFMLDHHADPGQSIEKVLEIVLYNVIAFITGTLADREFRGRLAQEKVARQLKESLDDLKAMEQQVLRTERLRALGELTAGLAHEIKNPLASLKGAAEIISDEIPASSARRAMVDILLKELDRLGAILEKFLSFARPKDVHVTTVPVVDVIEPVVELLQSQARTGGVEMEWDRACLDLAIRGDRETLKLVIMNLLLNAIQAMPKGGKVAIGCRAFSRGRRIYCEIAIEDSGPGVAEHMVEKIFNPFVTTKDGGNGLGLSIAARIVDQHEGFVTVDKGKAGGAVFRVGLPLAQDRAPQGADVRTTPG